MSNTREDTIRLTIVPGPHERADAAANRRLLLETAERLFNERGVAEVTMADIAAVAGVGKGTLYRRFSNKAELALELMHNQMSEFQNRTFAALREQQGQGRPYLYQLDSFLDSLVYFTETHLPLLCEVQHDGLVPQARAHTMPYHWQHQTVAALLQRATHAGELSPEIDIPYTADALLAPLRVDLFRMQREVRGFSLERISEGLRALVMALRRV